MKKVLRIRYGTKEWDSYRNNGIGCSEIGTVFGLNEYEPKAKLFHKKIGDMSFKQDYNRFMFFGHISEDEIAKLWEYYDPTIEGGNLIENYQEKKKIRKCIKPNAIYINTKYPYLFGNPDRIIPKGQFDCVAFTKLKKTGILELKNTTSLMLNKWENGFPDSWILQIHGYMMLLETDYAEIAMKIDGNNFNVVPIARNEELIQLIDEKCREFWEKVLKGREALKNKNLALTKEEEERYSAIIDELEPLPEESDAYIYYLRERYRPDYYKAIEGLLEHYEIAKKIIQINKEIKEKEKERDLLKNTLSQYMLSNGCTKIVFNEKDYAVWEARGKATTPSLYLHMK